MRDLLLILVHPLSGDDDLDAAVGAQMGEAGLRLQKGVFLRVCAVDAFDAQIGLGKAGGDIPRRKRWETSRFDCLFRSS